MKSEGLKRTLEEVKFPSHARTLVEKSNPHSQIKGRGLAWTAREPAPL